ncbi:BAR_ACAPs and ArfGap_ACAP domain-containing protein [Tachysurus ichikawai]
MDHFLDFEECIRDSPVFRLSLERRENDLEELESRMEKVIRSCNKMVDDGQVFCSSNQLFLSALSDLTSHHKNNTAVENCLQQFNQALQEMIHFHTILLDQTRRAITQQLTNLLTQFLPPLRSARCECVRIRDELNTALVKNAQVPQYKVAEAQRHTHLLLATHKCYTHCSLDYCLQLNNFFTQQKLDTLNSVFSFFHAQNTFFHQGFDLLKDLEPTMKIMAAEVCLLLKRGANQYAADEKGKDPLSIAIETAHADIVTLLRMARMNEEMRESEGFFGSVGDDETFQDIVRDFSNMASHDPEQLMRRHFRAQDESQEERTDGKTPETSGGQDD